MLVRSPFKRPFSKMCPTRLRYPCSSQKNPEFFCFSAAVVSRCFSSFSQLSWFGSSPACISEVAGIFVNKLFQCFQPQNQLKNSRSLFAFCCAPSQTASLVGCSGYSDRTANHRRRRFFLYGPLPHVQQSKVHVGKTPLRPFTAKLVSRSRD